MGKIGEPGSLRLRPCAVLISFFCRDVGSANSGGALHKECIVPEAPADTLRPSFDIKQFYQRRKFGVLGQLDPICLISSQARPRALAEATPIVSSGAEWHGLDRATVVPRPDE